MNIKTVGSICSGIEAASVAWGPLGLEFKWFSEIADFPSDVLKNKYPDTPNIGDMSNITELMQNNQIDLPDVLCGGTPCQAFSLAGWKNGLEDERGNLTLKFVEIAEKNDLLRVEKGLSQSVIFWENVEGVLKDKTNAFGSLVSSLAGLDEVIENTKWSNSGLIRGPKRNVAWRVLDAKYFGVPQQRRRVYLLAGGKDFNPEEVLFELNHGPIKELPKSELKFTIDNQYFEVFREYTDCLYSAYGTKWNGNAAAYNGSLFVVQNGRIRRLTPLECERLMGFPDNYTNIEGAKRTPRYQAIGNSWAVPVIKWIGERLLNQKHEINIDGKNFTLSSIHHRLSDGSEFWDLGKDMVRTIEGAVINVSTLPEVLIPFDIKNVLSTEAPEKLYISPVGCYGIVRRKNERNLRMNRRLEEILLNIADEMSEEEIEKRSRVQKRGRFSDVQQTLNAKKIEDIEKKQEEQLAFF